MLKHIDCFTLYHVISVSVIASEVNKHCREFCLLVFIAMSLFLEEFWPLADWQ